MRYIVAVIAVLAIAAVAQAGCPQDSFTDRYSTWAGKATGPSDVVTVPAGTRLLFDESPAFVVSKIEVYGAALALCDVFGR